jgi:DNA polymerase/3'-5' exonuclease PolX
VLALRDQQMSEDQQREMSDLLARQREGSLDGVERCRLDELMHIYRRGMVQKAQALKVAVDRGLQPPLS